MTRGKPHPQRPGDRRAGPKRPARASAPAGDHAARGPTPRPGSALRTVDEVAEILAVGRSMIFALVKRGELQSVQIGRRRLFRIADVENFIASLPTSADNEHPR